jgi:hypothetical protein
MKFLSSGILEVKLMSRLLVKGQIGRGESTASKDISDLIALIEESRIIHVEKPPC